MSEPKKPNPGWFKKGDDPRRHLFSKAECVRGYLMATRDAKMPSRTRAWLRNKIRRYYRPPNDPDDETIDIADLRAAAKGDWLDDDDDEEGAES